MNQTDDNFAWTHTYLLGGIFAVTVTVTDNDGAVSAEFTSQAVVTGVGLVDGTLYVIGTNGKNHVYIKLGSDGGNQPRANIVNSGQSAFFNPVDRLTNKGAEFHS